MQATWMFFIYLSNYCFSQLNRETKDGTVPEKIAVYQHANKEVTTVT